MDFGWDHYLYTDNNEVTELAQKYNVSEGKANLINKVLKSDIKDSKGNAYTFENLSKLTINDLNMLLSSKNVVVDNVSSTGHHHGQVRALGPTLDTFQEVVLDWLQQSSIQELQQEAIYKK